MATALDILLSCHLCWEKIDSQHHRMLPCRHSFCEACIVEHFEKKFHENKFKAASDPDQKCPTCSTSLSIFNMQIESVEERLQRAVSHLNIDENITHLLKLAQEQQHKKQDHDYRMLEVEEESGGETRSEKKCGPCEKKNKTVSATDYCGECDKYFCEGCLTCHEDLFPDHVAVVSGPLLISLNGDTCGDSDDSGGGAGAEKSSQMIYPSSCPLHQLPGKYFCKNCCQSLCVSCCQDHTACGSPPPVLLDFNEETQKVERLLQKTNQLQRDVDRFADKTRRRVTELNNQCRERKDEILTRVERVTSALREQAWQVIADLETAKKVQNASLNKKLIFCDDVKEQIRNLKRDYSEMKSTRGGNGYRLSCCKDMDLKWSRLDYETKRGMATGSDVDVRVQYSDDFMDILGKLASLRLGHIDFISTIEPQYLSPERFRLVDVATQCALDTEDIGTQYQFSKNDISPIPILTKVKDTQLEEVAIDISGVTMTDDGYLFVCYFWEKRIFVYNLEGELQTQCRIPGHPYDISKLTETMFIVVLPDLCRVSFLEGSGDRKELTEIKSVSTSRKEYVSVCKVNDKILVCDTHMNVDMMCPEGVILSSVLSDRPRNDGIHKIIPGVFGTFWLLDRSIAIISCYRMEGTLLVSHLPTQDGSVCSTDDICFDDGGYMYCCNRGKLFCITPQETVSILWKFDYKFLKPSRLMLSTRQDQLLLVCKNGQKYHIITFKISKPQKNLESMNSHPGLLP